METPAGNGSGRVGSSDASGDIRTQPELGTSAPQKRKSAPAHATGAVEFVPLELLSPDETFRLREEADTSLLATSIGRLGQLSPVELRLVGTEAAGPRWQVVAGFRRIAAVRMLQRDRVLARLHDRLADDDAWGLALGHALLTEPLDADGLDALKAKLETRKVADWALELIEEARVRAPLAPALRDAFHDFLNRPRDAAKAPDETAARAESPPTEAAAPAAVEDEIVQADDFALDLAVRLNAINQDISAAFDAWSDLPKEGRELLVEQCRYVAELFPFLLEKKDG